MNYMLIPFKIPDQPFFNTYEESFLMDELFSK